MDFFLILIQALSFIVIVDAVLSWFVRDPKTFPRDMTGAIAGPLRAPFRALIKPESFGGIDVSPLLAILCLNLVAKALVSLQSGL